MATSIKQIKLSKEQIQSFLPLAVSLLVIVFISLVLLLPQVVKIPYLARELADIKNEVTLAQQGSLRFGEDKKQIALLENKAALFEERFPREIETTLLIDTLREITEEAKLKFSSIEPLPQRNYEIKGQDEFYMELPIKVRLNCNFFDMIKFIQKIENSPRLMKVSEMSIRNNPQLAWDHVVEITISTFAIGKNRK